MSMDRHLGQVSEYPATYAPRVLVGIPRDEGRRRLGLDGDLPFSGVDIWNAYELSWLDEKGKPVVAAAELRIPSSSPRIVESKSLKLYLNSLNNMRYASAVDVERLIQSDLNGVVGSAFDLRVTLLSDLGSSTLGAPVGHCIDDVDVEILTYDVDSQLLEGSAEPETNVEETLYSHLLKSNCPVTGQPDWATVSIRYRGNRIDRSVLLRYIVSFRNHDDFHEHCVERIFLDLQRYCRPKSLSVGARYTRRGGIDINPYRSNCEPLTENIRLWRQ